MDRRRRAHRGRRHRGVHGRAPGPAHHGRQRDRRADLGSGQLVMTDRDAGAPKVSGRSRRRISNQQEKGNMFKTVWSYVNDERGVETLEWIVVGALIVAVGIAVYTGALQGQLITAVNAIGGQITGLASS